MDVTARFVELVNGPVDRIDLATGALLIAAHARPDLDPAAQVARIDDLAASVPDRTFDGLRHHLFETARFTGCSQGYHQPDNSFLDHVLDSGRGLPISLSIIAIEVGRRVGVGLVGIGMPGHFLVRSLDLPDRFLDPFHDGAELDVAGCERLFRSIAGPEAPFHGVYLAPVDSAVILGRMTSNLVQAYQRAADLTGLRWAIRLRSACPGIGAQELIHLAQAQRRTGAIDEAADLIERALPDLQTDVAERWHGEVGRLRALLN